MIGEFVGVTFKPGQRVVRNPNVCDYIDTLLGEENVRRGIGIVLAVRDVFGATAVDVRWPHGDFTHFPIQLLPLPLAVMAPKRC